MNFAFPSSVDKSVKKSVTLDTKFMQTQTAKRSPNLIPEIVERLKAGEVIILPTDHVYALVANAYDPDAVDKLKKLKLSDSPQPLTILTRQEKASEIAKITQAAATMMDNFPYPVTMIVPAKNTLPEAVTNGFKNIFIVCPDQFIYDLVEAMPTPLVCTSVAVAEDAKVTTFEMAVRFFSGKVPLIVDGGRSKYGRNGTLIDFTVETPTIMTFGPVSVDDLRPILPGIVLPSHLMK